MKRVLFTITAAVALSSCIQDELLESQSPSEVVGAVTFESYLGRDAMTRASVEDAVTLNTKGFGVMAWYTGQDSYSEGYTSDDYDYDFMINTKVSNTDGTGWSYTPLKYWPNNEGDKLTFLAYAPYNAAYSTAADGASTALSQTIDFTVENEVKDQTDLLWSDNPENENMIKPAVDSKVLFTFKHALSRIGFKVAAFVDDVRTDEDSKSENLDASTVINVKKVMLVSGSTVYNTDNTVTPEGVFYTGGTLDLYNFTPADATENVPAAWDEKLQENDGQYFELTADSHFVNTTTDDADETVFQLSGENATTLQTLNADDSYIMIIPQNFTDEFTDGYKVYIEYDVVTTGDNALGESDGSTITNRILSEEVLTTNFLSGKAYTLNIWLGMTSVKFEVEVADWEWTWPDTDEYLPGNKVGESVFDVAEDVVTETGVPAFKIGSADELCTLRDMVNDNAMFSYNGENYHYSQATYVQAADIDLSAHLGQTDYGRTTFIPFGGDEADGMYSLFCGTYDGGGYTVSGVNHSGSYMSGLFYKVDGATIMNLTVEGTNEDSWAWWTGGVVGLAYNTTLISCHSRVTISSGTVTIPKTDDEGNLYYETPYPPTYVAGLIAEASLGCKIIGCTFGGKIDDKISSYSGYVGGVVGSLGSSELISSYSYGEVNAPYASMTGYVAAESYDSDVTSNCWKFVQGSSIGGFGSGDNDGNYVASNVADETYGVKAWSDVMTIMNDTFKTRNDADVDNTGYYNWHYELNSSADGAPLLLKEGVMTDNS